MVEGYRRADTLRYREERADPAGGRAPTVESAVAGQRELYLPGGELPG